MSTRFGALLLAASLLPLSGLLQAAPEADSQAGLHTGQGSFTEETTRTMNDGRVFKRKVEQQEGEGRFSRREQLTAPDGKTASHSLQRTLDAASGSWTTQEEGKGFDGRSWSRSQTGDAQLPVFGDAPKAPAVAESKPVEKPAAPAKPAGPKKREFR
ncbi:MAG: hypothetical protein REI12_11115 [Pedobacter sp.]|nr:hypothetical protein [Pedobacter sp.]